MCPVTGRIENNTLLHLPMSAHCSVLVQLAFISSLLRMELFLFCVCTCCVSILPLSGSLPFKHRTNEPHAAQPVALQVLGTRRRTSEELKCNAKIPFLSSPRKCVFTL